MSLTFKSVSHSYGSTRVLKDISFTASEGEILCLLGPSGGGKSTLLRLAAGLERLQSGEIQLNNTTLATPGSHPPAESRPIGMVFQDHVLFPHLTVSENITFGLHDLAVDLRRARTQVLLEQVNLTGLEKRFPHELSGGQQQRVALARALAPEPEVLLLDEPFASVDSTLRRALRQTARDTLKAAGTTAIVVTHDPEEAMQLADSIAIMADGTIAQHASPADIWRTPATLDVALLFGDAQALHGQCEAGKVRLGAVSLDAPDLPSGPVSAALRPRGVRLRKPQPSDTHRMTVTDIRLIGHAWQVYLSAPDTTTPQLIAAIEDPQHLSIGSEWVASLSPEECFLFPT